MTLTVAENLVDTLARADVRVWRVNSWVGLSCESESSDPFGSVWQPRRGTPGSLHAADSQAAIAIFAKNAEKTPDSALRLSVLATNSWIFKFQSIKDLPGRVTNS